MAESIHQPATVSEQEQEQEIYACASPVQYRCRLKSKKPRPSVLTRLYSVQCTVFGELWSVHCSLHTVHCTLHIAHSTVQYTVYSLQFTVYSVHCRVCTAHCKLYTVNCPRPHDRFIRRRSVAEFQNTWQFQSMISLNFWKHCWTFSKAQINQEYNYAQRHLGHWFVKCVVSNSRQNLNSWNIIKKIKYFFFHSKLYMLGFQTIVRKSKTNLGADILKVDFVARSNFIFLNCAQEKIAKTSLKIT